MSYAQHHAQAPTHARIGILTISDTKGPDQDESGDRIQATLQAAGHEVRARAFCRDEPKEIRRRIHDLLEHADVDAIITTGGTGVSPRDVTIETIRPLFAPELPGFGEVFRLLSHETIQSGAILSRASAGIVKASRARKPVFCLPGSTQACELACTRLIGPELGHLVELANGAHATHG